MPREGPESKQSWNHVHVPLGLKSNRGGCDPPGTLHNEASAGTKGLLQNCASMPREALQAPVNCAVQPMYIAWCGDQIDVTRIGDRRGCESWSLNDRRVH